MISELNLTEPKEQEQEEEDQQFYSQKTLSMEQQDREEFGVRVEEAKGDRNLFSRKESRMSQDVRQLVNTNM
jgi:hypothetical protein